MEEGKLNPKRSYQFVLKACKIISKGFIYHIVRVNDIESKIPPLESVPVVKYFLEVNPDNLPVIPPE